MTLLRPSHTFASVARELVEGLENGTIYLDESEPSVLAGNGLVGSETDRPQVQSALHECVRALERVASYEMPPDLERRLRLLGETKEFLAGPVHDDLLALVRRHRMILG